VKVVIAFGVLVLVGTAIGLTYIASQTPSPKNTVSGYLNAIQSLSRDEINKFECTQTPTKTRELEAIGKIQSWEIIDIGTTTKDGDPDAKYNQVQAKITYNSNSGAGLVSKSFIIDVWETDRIFESWKRLEDEMNTLILKAQRTLGEKEEVPPARERSDYSSNKYCINSKLAT